MLGGLGLSFVAGLLSTLSPCVLPLLPLVLGAAATAHRLGPVALAGGLALSFVVIGLFVATIGFGIGVDGDAVRTVAAILLLGFGLVLMIPALQARVAMAAAPFGSWADRRFGGAVGRTGLRGQFAVGLLLGAVWSPCVGPTLGAASVLAARGQDLGAVALTMALFGIGAALPLLALGSISRQALLRWRGRLAAAGRGLRVALGAGLAATAAAILLGLDRVVEAALVDHSPDWLTALTTRF